MRPKTVGFLIAVAVAGTALLVGCNDGSARLDSLRNDPLGHVELDGAVDVSVAEFTGSTGGGVDAPSRIRHSFTVAPGGVTQAKANLAEIARNAGWNVAEADFGFTGSKTVDGLASQLRIDGLDVENLAYIEISTRA